MCRNGASQGAKWILVGLFLGSLGAVACLLLLLVHSGAGLMTKMSWVVYAGSIEPEPSRLFESGNQSYSQGDFKTAIEQYEILVRMPMSNEILYYNLGNAYFKNGQIGSAILNYERALKLAPQDRDILANLELARSRIADKIENRQENVLWKPLKNLNALIPFEAETLLVVFLFLAANGCFTTFLLSRSAAVSRLALFAAGGCLLLSLLFGFSNGMRYYQNETIKEGVVLVDKADVLSGPAADNSVLFSVHEGLKFRIENELDAWFHVSLENGWNGWIKKEAVGMI